jgi:hypothetical protein
MKPGSLFKIYHSTFKIKKNCFMKYYIISISALLVFNACSSFSDTRGDLRISNETVDTIRTRPAKLDAKPLLFEAAFIKGTTHKSKDATMQLYGVNIGSLKISSGAVVACDPGHIDEYGIPFTQVFPNGEFPVQLAIGKLGNEETIAFARILFSDAPVARWEFALQEGQSPIPVGGKKMHGYSTDLGLGIFVDYAASKALDKTNLTRLDAGMYKEMDRHYHNDWRYSLHNFGNHNLAVFSSGLGDGYYASYIGFDASGKPCRLLTDFNIIDWKGR